MPTALTSSRPPKAGAAGNGARKSAAGPRDPLAMSTASVVAATPAVATAGKDAPAPPKLASVKLDNDHAREVARQLEAGGRSADAKAILAVLERRGRVVFTMPIDEALKVAMAMHKDGAGAAKTAEIYYKAVLAADPAHARAHHFLGVLLHNTRRTRQAMPHLLKSAELLGDQAWLWNNLAIVYRETSQYEKAEEAYLKALSIREDYPEAHNNLGVVYRWLKRWEDSRRHYLRALELRPDYVEAHLNLGKLQFGLKEIEAAMASFSRGILLYPKAASQSRNMLARAHLTLGQRDKAADVYRAWLEEEPDNPAARHLLTACLGEDTPDRAADDYVASAFDGFANSFDAKLAHLGYRAPQLVAAALATAHDENQSYGIVADAGCGTGLCGPLIRKRTKRLIGVDLSSGMLAKAKERGGYDELHEAELTAFLLTKKNAYNVIISADTLCYFGVLTDFAKAAYDALKPNGALIFTVEALPDDSASPHLLLVHGRYAHRRSYIEQALGEGGFAIEAIRKDDLRMEDAKPVVGWLVTARKAG